MAKLKTAFVCQQCGMTATKWLGRCPDCDSWNSFVEEESVSKPLTSGARLGTTRKPVPYPDVETDSTMRVTSAGGGVRQGARRRHAFPGRSCFSAAIRGSGNRRFCSKLRRSDPAMARTSSTSAVRSPNARFKLRGERLGVVSRSLLLLQRDPVGSYYRNPQTHLARLGRCRLRANGLLSEIFLGTGQYQPGERSYCGASLLRQVLGYSSLFDRSREQGGQPGRSQGPRAHGRYRSLLRGRKPSFSPRGASGEKSLWGGWRAGRVRDGGRTGFGPS